MAISIQKMVETGAHFGHRTQSWNPKMRNYIFGERDRIHIIDLEKTVTMMQDSLNFISRIASKGTVLFVGTKPAAYELVKKHAERCGMPYVNHRWLGGMITNFRTIRQSIKRLKDLETMRNIGSFNHMIKKEALRMQRDLAKLERSLGGIKNMTGLPDALVIIDVGHEKIAVAEANRLHIPIVGVVDTNNDPSNIDYVIPGNDDSSKAIDLYLGTIADLILDIRASETQPVKEASDA